MSGELKNIECFKSLLLAGCGFQFGNERERSLREALSCRIGCRGGVGEDAYYEILAADPREMQVLVELLTVNETYFMREPEYLHLLVDRLIPELLARDGGGNGLEIFCAGCASGEEAYSLAILLDQRFGSAADRLFKIVAGDIDGGVIAAARRGIYGPHAFRGESAKWRDRYFTPRSAGEWQLEEQIRRRVQFELCNLLAPAYPMAVGRPQIVLYRNVSIYFPSPVQRQIFTRLAGQMAENGYLLVGASETIHHHDFRILALEKRDQLYFFRKSPTVAPARRSPSPRVAFSSVQPGQPAKHQPQQAGLKFTPPGTAPPAPRLAKVQSLRESAAADPFNEALALARRQCFAEALELLRGIVERDRSCGRAYALEGCILVELDDFAEARQRGLIAIEHDPLCLEAYLLLGISARQRADYAEAGRRFREALYIDRACWSAHFYLAETTYALGDADRARRSYRSALEVLQNQADHEPESFFPLNCNRAHFVSICRHKISQLAAKAN